jgi:hypothetical protein
MSCENSESMPVEDGWTFDPLDDRSWVRVVLLILVAVVLWGCYRIAVRWWNPAGPVVRIVISVPNDGTAVFSFPEGRSYLVESIYVVGSPDWSKLTRAGMVPPRCRNVAEGQGCIDWLEAGEKDWEQVLGKNRFPNPAGDKK